MTDHVRYTRRLRLEPIGQRHVDDLIVLQADPHIAAWYGSGCSRTDSIIERVVEPRDNPVPFILAVVDRKAA